MPEPQVDVTPDGTFLFEVQRPDGTRAVVTVFPEDVDEIAGPATATPLPPEERQRRIRVARLLADSELQREAAGAPPEAGYAGYVTASSESADDLDDDDFDDLDDDEFDDLDELDDDAYDGMDDDATGGR